MYPSIIDNKNELINWLTKLKDEKIISKILEIKNASQDCKEPIMPYEKKKLEKKVSTGYTSAEARKESLRRIDEWWGK